MSDARTFSWKPIGGLGEVGMNCMVLRFGDTVIPVDAGILFANANDFGIEAVHPDFREVFAGDAEVPYWFITHAHEDHIGAVSAVLQVCHDLGRTPPDILAPPLAAALMRERLQDERRYPDARRYAACIKDVGTDAVLTVNDVEVRFLETRHSTLDTCSLAIEWKRSDRPLRLVHTADFKLDAHAFTDGVRDLAAVYGSCREDARGGPDFLFIDSTNSEREGHSVSESELLPGLEHVLRTSTGRVFVTLFSSNIQRVAALVDIAAKIGRYACLAGRSLQTAHRIAQQLGLYGSRCAPLRTDHLMDSGQLARLAPDKQLVLCSGSQGESRSVLARLAQGTHPDFALHAGDTVLFSSKLIPGNEKSVSRLINGLLRQGARVLMGDQARLEAGGPVHASGHARRDEIAAVMKFLKPRQIIPVHGEFRQLSACAEIARREGEAWGLGPADVHIAENGTELVFGPSPHGEGWSLVERVPAPEEIPERILRFEDFVSPSRDNFLRSRKRAASGGVVSVAIDAVGGISILHRGILPEAWMQGEAGEALEASIHGWVHAKLRPRVARETIEELEDGLARHLRREIGFRPLVLFHRV